VYLLHTPQGNLSQTVFLLLSFLFSITFSSSSWLPGSCFHLWTIGFRWGKLHIQNYIFKEKKWENSCRFFSFLFYLSNSSDSYMIYLIQMPQHTLYERIDHRVILAHFGQPKIKNLGHPFLVEHNIVSLYLPLFLISSVCYFYTFFSRMFSFLLLIRRCNPLGFMNCHLAHLLIWDFACIDLTIHSLL
jgi:hypothetical protein